MPEAIAGFCVVLPKKASRGVTVIAHCKRAMGRLYPAGVLLAHDVTVCAGCRVVGHVRPTPRVRERVPDYAHCCAYCYPQRNSPNRAQSHPVSFCIGTRLYIAPFKTESAC